MTPRLSFEEWLRKKGLVGKNENTAKQNRHAAVINYLFQGEKSASDFATACNLRLPVFRDRLSGVQSSLPVLAQYIPQKNPALLPVLSKADEQTYAQKTHNLEKDVARLDANAIAELGTMVEAGSRDAHRALMKLATSQNVEALAKMAQNPGALRILAKMAQEGKHEALMAFSKSQALAALPIDEKAYAQLQEMYLRETRPCTAAEIKAQLQLVTEAKNFLEDKNLSKVTERLDILQELTTNLRPGGTISYQAMSAYHTSLQCYIALNKHLFNEADYNGILSTSRLLMEKGDVGTGLRQDVNWWARITTLSQDARYKNQSVHAVFNAVRRQYEAHSEQDAKDYLDGQAKREIVSEEKATRYRSIPHFMPKPGSAGVDQILFHTGDTASHFTVSRIWKVAVDAKGIPITKNRNGEAVHHYRFYYTKHNAGYGGNFLEQPTQATAGIVYGSETREILPTWDEGRYASLDAYYQKVRENIIELMKAERLLSACPEDSWYRDDYRTVINSLISDEIVLGKCTVNVPQTSGNCTVMSQKATLIGVSQHGHPLESILEEHWRFAKTTNRASLIKSLTEKQKALEAALEVALKAQEEEQDCEVLPPGGALIGGTSSLVSLYGPVPGGPSHFPPAAAAAAAFAPAAAVAVAATPKPVPSLLPIAAAVASSHATPTPAAAIPVAAAHSPAGPVLAAIAGPLPAYTVSPVSPPPAYAVSPALPAAAAAAAPPAASPAVAATVAVPAMADTSAFPAPAPLEEKGAVIDGTQAASNALMRVGKALSAVQLPHAGLILATAVVTAGENLHRFFQPAAPKPVAHAAAAVAAPAKKKVVVLS